MATRQTHTTEGRGGTEALRRTEGQHQHGEARSAAETKPHTSDPGTKRQTQVALRAAASALVTAAAGVHGSDLALVLLRDHVALELEGGAQLATLDAGGDVSGGKN
jgi:hypothetical protein